MKLIQYLFMLQYEKLNSELEEQLLFITQETQCIIKQAELSVPICINALDAIKKLVHKRSFKSPKEEIFFFKSFKPKVSSRLIYYVQVFNIETCKPFGTSKQQKKYFLKHLRNLNRFVEENLDFYQYYRSDSIFLDEKYFIRGKADLHLILDENFFNFDTTFNTSHDHVVAKILAYDMLTLHIRNELNKIINQNEQGPIREIHNHKLVWTESKVALIELIYAFHELGCFNKGTLEIKELSIRLSEVFNIEVGDIYRTFAEIRLRKDPTKFLQTLQTLLENKIKEDLK